MKKENNNASYFSTFVNTCEQIKNISSKNGKVSLIGRYITNLQEEDLQIAILFLSGRIFPRGSTFNLSIGFRTILQCLVEISNLTRSDVIKVHLEHGDMGSIAEFAVSKKKTVTLFNLFDESIESLTLQDIYAQFKKIAKSSGSRSNYNKKVLLKGLIMRCNPIEAKYLVKLIANEMRIGSYEGLAEMAIAKTFDKDIGNVREAMLISGDIAQVALLSKRNLLNTITIKPFVPMSFMLADVMFTSEEIITYYQKPLICEYKYDGIRVQMHKFGDQCKIFSRNLVEISFAFPEIINSALKMKMKMKNDEVSVLEKKKIQDDYQKNSPRIQHYNYDFILDGELIGYKNGSPLPFQELQKRLQRKNITKKIEDEIPVCYIVYDIMLYNKRSVIKEPLENRKKLLSCFLFEDSNIFIAQSKIVNFKGEIDDYFKKSKDSGFEGLVIKDPQSLYYPGKRGRYWIKLKQELDTIDAVIILAEYGHGKRAGSLSDYTLAVKNSNSSIRYHKKINNNEEEYDYLTGLTIIGKAYSGLSDKEIEYVTRKLKSLVIKNEGNRLYVKPEIILEVSFDTIQKSNRHDSGYALRFPRIKNIRYDKKLDDIDELNKIKLIYENQFHIKNRAGS